MAEESYRFRLWVQILAIAGLIYNSLFLFTALTMLLISTLYGRDVSRKIFENVPSGLLPDVLLVPDNVDFESGTVSKLLGGMALLIAILKVVVAVSLVRGSASGVDPLKAFHLVRIWRNWTILLSAIFFIDYAREGALLTFDYFVPLGVSAVQFIFVILFAQELKQRIKSEKSPPREEECCYKKRESV